MKAMSIIGIVIFSLFMLIMFAGVVSIHNNEDAAVMAFFGILGLMFALALAIVGVVYSSKKKNGGN